MSEHQQFMRALRANPEDLGLALIYADWLEEHATASPLVMGGMAERAQYLRLTCQTNPAPASATEPYPNQYEMLWFYFSHLWIPEEIKSVFGHCNQILNPNDACCVLWRNGFIRTVRCRLSQVFRYGPQLVRWHPVTHWEISDATQQLTLGVFLEYGEQFFNDLARMGRNLHRRRGTGPVLFPHDLMPPRSRTVQIQSYAHHFDRLLDAQRQEGYESPTMAVAQKRLSQALVQWCNQQADNLEDWCDAEIP